MLRREVPDLEYSEKYLANLRVKGDSGDIYCCGYTVYFSSEIAIPLVYHNNFPICSYLDLEYYRKPLEGIHKILQPISNFLKGDHSIDFLLNTYSLLQQQAILNESIERFRRWYGERSLAEVDILSESEAPQ